MKVILLSDVRGSGKKGEVVKVSDGYAKNYLLPKNFAKEATPQALQELLNEKSSLEHKRELEKEEAQRIAEIINGKSVTIVSKVGDGGKLFGAVTAKDIAAKLSEMYDVSVDKRKIHLNEDIKSLGTYNCEVKVYSGITAEMHITVTDR